MNKYTNNILIGIFICLLIIAFKPYPKSNPEIYNLESNTKPNPEQFISLGDQKIAYFEPMNQEIIVFEYDTTLKKFTKLSTDNLQLLIH
jgi:hypothetical protein